MNAIRNPAMRLAALVSAGVCAALTIGCDMGTSGSRFGGIGYTGYKRDIMCPLSDVKMAEALALGRRVLANHGFRVKSADVDNYSIETYPNEKTERGNEGRIRDGLKLPNRVRRTASLEFAKRGSDMEAWCQVKIDRLTTSDHRVWAGQREFDDVPTQTPIDREAATTDKQNTVWTSAGRDESMEREILSDLRNRIQLLRQKRQAQQTQPS